MPKPAVYFAVAKIADLTARSTLGRQILLQAVSMVTGQVPDQYCIATEASGRPLAVPRQGSDKEVFVSLSHSGTWLAGAATALGPVGIDVEVMRPERDLEGIADIAFGPAERRRYARDGRCGFYRIWTLREAIAKAHGTGLDMAADGRDRVSDGPDEGTWQWQSGHLAHWRQAPNLALALALWPSTPLADIAWTRFVPAIGQPSAC